jgi:hypothetical protein
LWKPRTALEATAGISLAVMASIGRSLRDGEPPVAVLKAVVDDTDWLDSHMD